MTIAVTLLGTGTPAPNPQRNQSAVLVEVADDLQLFDAGRGVINQIARTGAEIPRVNPVFITHHHADHIGDLFDVMITTALAGRDQTLDIYGPPGTTGIVQALIDQVYANDIRSRLEEEENCRRLGFPVHPLAARIADVACHDIVSGVVRETADWRVVADEVRHGDYAHAADFDWRCLGYRIECGGKVVTISGDTVPCEGIIRLARDADLLVQCCHFPQSAVNGDAIRHATQTTLPSSGQVGVIARDAGVKQVVLTHLSMQIAGAEMIEQVCRDVRANFSGTVVAGEDLLRLEL